MLTHIHPSRLQFTCRTRPITEGSSHLWLTHPGPTRCPEPLCPLRVLPFEGWCFPPPREALPPHHRSYGLMRQTKTLPPPSIYTAGLCRLSPVPAGRWPFPTLSPQVFPQVPGPLPRWVPLVHLPVSSQRNIGLPRITNRSASHNNPHRDFSTEVFTGLQSFRYVQAPGFAHHPGRSYRSSTPVELGSRDFYFRAPHGSLPPRVPDILVVRIGQLTTGDLAATAFSRSLTP